LNNYPADSDVVMLLCDDFRLEIGNKITLLGWLTGGDLRIPADADAKAVVLQSLCVIFLLRSGQGTFNVSIRVIGPEAEGNSLESPHADLIKDPEMPAVHIVKIAPFHPQIGTYIVELNLDGNRYQRNFKVARTDPATVSPQPLRY
jgi:hypothetical protein